ncbi:Aldehyde dehydrogenase [Sinorhizobium sojae CCBAU 05684]|uniref:Aldehyde dehydrogenase n=1 Tax=Sinorhizobium sojae CCBAU 05684 TaxID=716928 RepID=A0A249PA06_9HYPH|nr:aldehyde dehydrogenase family protein [Sinorhizobium sojae]ASY62582.1 Aldehyde dehydrogenase [Sinorhizobium sojae CCBAU 05684]
MSTRQYTHFINGRFEREAASYVDRTSPASGELVARFASGQVADMDRAVAAARAAFDHGPWPQMSGMQRTEILNKFADLVEKNFDRLVRIEVEEVGKPIRFAKGDIAGCVGLIRYAASLAMQMSGTTYTNLGSNKTALLMREPVGVVALITPWNFPALILMQKVPFALAAGCAVVVKPSEFTSGSAFELAALATEAGVPDGVFNVVSGKGSVIGQSLTEHADVDFISFTGSTRIGQTVIEASAKHIVKTSLELGGKSANIVFADADLDAAVDGALMGVFFNNGECCVSGSRLFVQSSIADDFVRRVSERAALLKVGNPFDDDTDIGAMIDSKHLSKVMSLVDTGLTEGAKLLTGGNVVENSAGNFVQPTIFDHVTPSMTIFQEEIFGPVLSVTRFDTLDEVIELANNSIYGLSNYVWSKNIDTVMTISRRLKSGWVQANTIIDGAPQLPLTGVKGSGFGYEMGQAGFEEFTQIKTLFLHTGPREPVFAK